MGKNNRGRLLVTALMVVLTTLGVASATTSGAGAVLTAGATERVERQATIELLASIPGSYREGCQIFDTLANDTTLGQFAGHIVASMRCYPASGADVVFYTQFDGVAAMDAAFDAYNPQPGDGTDGCPGTGTWSQRGATAGRWTCYLAENFDNVPAAAVINWTHAGSAILANAYRRDDDIAALDTWWTSADAGPLAAPSTDGLPSVLSARQWLDNAAALKRRSVPASHRASCHPAALTADSLGPALYPVRMWLVAALFCRARGVGVVDYYEFAPGSTGGARAERVTALSSFFARQADGEVDEEEPRVTAASLDCESRGTWSRKGHEVGEYACWYVGDGETADYAAMEWTDTGLGILGYATSVDGRAAPLLRFWANDAGPVVKGT